MATISIHGNEMTIQVQGLGPTVALRSQLTSLLAHVRGAIADADLARHPQGWSGPGTRFPRHHRRRNLPPRR